MKDRPLVIRHPLYLVLLFLSLIPIAAALAQSAGEHMHLHTAQAESFFENFFKVYVPRKQCMYHEAAVIWLHAVSDFLIAAAYYSIPLALASFIRRRKDLAFKGIFWLFAIFILACGTTHAIGVLDLWHPLYKVDGAVKLITAIASVGTAVALWRVMPQALLLKSPSELEGVVALRTQELGEMNSRLRQEVAARTEAERVREDLLQREQEARRAAETANRMKDEFLATLSHELRTPLNSILGWAQLLNGDKSLMETHKELSRGLSVIARNAQLQSQLINDLLDMSRIVSGKLLLKTEPVDPAQTLKNAVNAVKPAAQAKEITIVENYCFPPVTVLADSARLQQVYWNLLSNAIKFTPAGGSIRVTLEREEATSVKVVISDTGEGIDSEFLPFVFERFRQADASITRKFGGLGLGLSIVRHLIELHGGRVSVASPGVGKGATFSVSLPIRINSPDDMPASKEEAGNEESNISLEGCSLLVVEDDNDTRHFLEHLLRKAGALVVAVSNAQDARSRMDQQHFQGILCDIGMPHEDGFSFIRSVRASQNRSNSETPAIALTAFASYRDRAKAIRAGFQTHLPKPVDPEELLLAVAALVGIRAGT